MGKKILYAFLIVLLIVNAVLLYLIVDKKMSKGPSKGQTFLTEQLNFSEAQKATFFMLDEEHRGKMMRLDDRLKGLREVLFQSFERDREFIAALTNQMGELETQKFNELFSFFGKVRELCDEDQVKKFDQIIDEVLHKRGSKDPKGKPNRLPPPPPQ